ncbi:MAG TPA: hypothetical protein VOA64_16295 [Candidatus Dormibacteraeota bacterium]|nr:hypothetical protein [Candidatus Dormibacteraeota bacterium]
MNDPGGNFADEPKDAVGRNVANANTELRKRRSTRIVQAVPLTVTGVDALGRPFTERTSSLIINCHGCRYQSKHYVLKNMWVTLEIPHPESEHPPRTVRGRVAWIQRPRTVRQLFQVALELEQPGNAWGIAFPPEDWFPLPETGYEGTASAPTEATHAPSTSAEPELGTPHDEQELVSEAGSDNLRVFPSPTSVTDASLQLARQLARLVADAKQQIQAAVREAAGIAVAAERQVSFEQWEKKFATARAELANELSKAIEQIQHGADEHARSAHAAAGEALRNELPVKLLPQLEQLTRDLAAQLSQEGAAQRSENIKQLTAAAETLRRVCQQAEAAGAKIELQAEQANAQIAARGLAVARAAAEATRLREEAGAKLKAQAEEADAQIVARALAVSRAADEAARLQEVAGANVEKQAEQAEARMAARAEAAMRSVDDAARQREEEAARQRDSMLAAADEAQQQVTTALASAQSSWNDQLARELVAAQARWQAAMESTLRPVQERLATDLTEHARALSNQLAEEAGRQATSLRNGAVDVAAEMELRLNNLRDALQGHIQRLESAVTQAAESTTRMEDFSKRLANAQEHALAGFRLQVDDALSLHSGELYRRSEFLFDEIDARIRAAFERESKQAATQFDQRLGSLVQSHALRAEEAVQRMETARSLLDTELRSHQDHIRATADEAFADSLLRFRENLGSVEQLLSELSQAVTEKSLTDLEGKVNELRHQTIEDVYKSAEWYEKKAQTQIQNAAEKVVEQTSMHLREKAGEFSSVFASELDHSSRNFVVHSQTQMEEVVRDAFERARALISEAAETTSAAFTDDIQRTGRQELDGFGEELHKSLREVRAQLDDVRTELTHQVTAEQENFLRRFRSEMSGAVEAGVAEAHGRLEGSFAPLFDSWRAITDNYQAELRNVYARIGEQSTEQYRTRLENVSNQWMLATVASLDHQSRDVVASISATAEERLRETCTQVFAEIGEILRSKLQEIAHDWTPRTPDSPSRSKGAATGS